ncbi:hypothetical protein KC19_7G187100 [Ceratodon purpureus]|uniref:Uncharacterized protein n=1 Tax=Ceratodon purpureus TaxID=3225 RepID=A0A8T0HCS9_CERPU|nr:hypothetical protein KC19_7G187100 [Ceratodon purpureus]
MPCHRAERTENATLALPRSLARSSPCLQGRPNFHTSRASRGLLPHHALRRAPQPPRHCAPGIRPACPLPHLRSFRRHSQTLQTQGPRPAAPPPHSDGCHNPVLQ